MATDYTLKFEEHILTVCKKVNNQFNVILRFQKLISKSTMLKLYKTFILPHFNYSSTIDKYCPGSAQELLYAWLVEAVCQDSSAFQIL